MINATDDILLTPGGQAEVDILPTATCKPTSRTRLKTPQHPSEISQVRVVDMVQIKSKCGPRYVLLRSHLTMLLQLFDILNRASCYEFKKDY